MCRQFDSVRRHLKRLYKGCTFIKSFFVPLLVGRYKMLYTVFYELVNIYG